MIIRSQSNFWEQLQSQLIKVIKLFIKKLLIFLGEFTFSDLTIYGETNQTYYLLINIEAISSFHYVDFFPNEISTISEYFFSIPLTMNNCPSGYIYISFTTT